MFVAFSAVTKARVWAIERQCFQQVMMRQGLQRIEDNLAFLAEVSFLKNLSNDHLSRIADALELVSQDLLMFSKLIKNGIN